MIYTTKQVFLIHFFVRHRENTVNMNDKHCEKTGTRLPVNGSFSRLFLFVALLLIFVFGLGASTKETVVADLPGFAFSRIYYTEGYPEELYGHSDSFASSLGLGWYHMFNDHIGIGSNLTFFALPSDAWQSYGSIKATAELFWRIGTINAGIPIDVCLQAGAGVFGAVVVGESHPRMGGGTAGVYPLARLGLALETEVRDKNPGTINIRLYASVDDSIQKGTNVFSVTAGIGISVPDVFGDVEEAKE